MATFKSTIKLDLNSSAVKRGLANLKTRFGSLASAMKKGFLAVGAASTAAFGAAVVALQKFRTEFDRVGKLATRLNETPETIQRIGLAARIAGTDVEVVTKGLQRLARVLFDSATGSGEYADAMKLLRIDAQEFMKLSPEKQLLALAQAYKAAGQDAKTLAAVQELLGRSGADLIPLLVQGPESLARTMERAKVVGNDAVRVYEKFNDDLTAISQNIKAALAQAFSGPIEDAREGLRIFLNESGQLTGKKAVEALKLGGLSRVNMASADVAQWFSNKLRPLNVGSDTSWLRINFTDALDRFARERMQVDSDMKYYLKEARDALEEAKFQNAVNTGRPWEAP